MAGTNGSTTFTDTSPVGNTMTAVSAQISNASPLGGLNAALIAANSSSTNNPFGVQCPITAGAPLDILSGTADFTIEGWFLNPTGSSNNSFSPVSYGDAAASAGANLHGIVLRGNAGGGGAGAATMNLNVGISGWSALSLSSFTIAPNTWHHFAITRVSGTGWIFVDGVGTHTGSADWASYAGPPASSIVSVGGSGIASNDDFANGLMVADFRVTAGTARYTANFVPPTAPFATISCTQTVPNLVGQTLAQAQSTNTAAGYVTTVQESNHPNIATGLVISQNPAAGSVVPLGTNIILQLSVGPVTTAGMGGDVWGSTGGGNIQAQGQTPIGQALAYATQRDNAVVQANQSVLAALAMGSLNPTSVAATTQATPATSVPTAPTMG